VRLGICVMSRNLIALLTGTEISYLVFRFSLTVAIGFHLNRKECAPRSRADGLAGGRALPDASDGQIDTRGFSDVFLRYSTRLGDCEAEPNYESGKISRQ
jgi:hypothetical protein